jgi:SAM-dependent methyltransferase
MNTPELCPPLKKRSLLEVIEGYYQGHIVYQLHELGAFERLAKGRDTAALAADLGVEADIVTALIEFLYQTSDLLVRTRSGAYRLSSRYRDYYHFGFQLDKFIGAYGPPFVNLKASLRSPTLGREWIDRRAQAQAYYKMDPPFIPFVVDVVRERGIQSLVDLGCGPATLLRELGRIHPGFCGWGIDASPDMCRVARARVSEEALASRICILEGDARQTAKLLTPKIRRKIMAIFCKGLINEMFRSAGDEAILFLSLLRRSFPDKVLIVVDYYGKLTHVSPILSVHRHTMLHDLIQSVSAQGVPPPDREGWFRLYYSAGCTVEQAYEAESEGIRWFVHVVKLSDIL